MCSKSYHPMDGIDSLLRLLGDWALLGTNIATDIGGIRGLPDDVLEGSPGLSGGRWSALVSELGVDAGSELSDGSLDEAALCVAGAEEYGIDNQQNPSSGLEEKGGSKDTEPQGDFENSDESHAGIVVLLDELADGVRKAGSLGLGAWLGRLLWGLKDGEKRRADISYNVENGVNSKREHSQRDLAREEPDQSHD